MLTTVELALSVLFLLLHIFLTLKLLPNKTVIFVFILFHSDILEIIPWWLFRRVPKQNLKCLLTQ